MSLRQALGRVLLSCLVMGVQATDWLGFGELTASVWASSPRLGGVSPRGVQRGTEHLITFSGSNLQDAQEVLFYDKGFEVTKLEAEGGSVKATVKVVDDCRLGEHLTQIRTASGLSDFRTFWVEALPPIAEKEPNSDFSMPQPIDLNGVVVGDIGGEDVDYYLVEAKQGQRISAEVVAMRLSGALFDAYVAILDKKRFELSASDDTALALQDPFASIVAPEDGQYIIEVRESAYGGGSRYRMHVGTFPRPTAVFPAGGKIGESTEVRFLGLPSGELVQNIALPDQVVSEFGVVAQDDGGLAPTPNAFRLFEHGNSFEQEPNDEIAEATSVELPLAINGIIEKKGDVDCFKFSAKKGQTYEVECYARRVRSALDSVMNLYRADGNELDGKDDSRGPDSYFRWTVPEDGEYVVRVTDHLGNGGPDYVYRIEFQSVRPRLTLGIPRVERYGQYRQQIYVARGNRFGSLITAGRNDFSGDLILEEKDIPEGIQIHAEPMPGNMNVMPVVFEAAVDAPLSGSLVKFTARHVDPNQDVQGGFRNRADFIISGQTVFRSKDVELLAIAVVDELPFTLEIVEPQVPLVRNGSMQLKIVAHRKEGFQAAIGVQLPFRPPGMNATDSVTIPEGQSEVLYPINANDGAALKEWGIFVLGSADVNGTAWVSSQLATLEIAEPYVTFEMQRASCEQGEDAQLYCKINHNQPFEGKAKVQLIGLPAKITTDEFLEFDKDTEELTFNVKTVPDSPDGKHKNLFCQVTITEQGEPIVSRVGNTELQIDKPLPAPTNQPAPEPKKEEVAKEPEPEKPKAKPLTRLQKLRLAYKQRLAARAGKQPVATPESGE